MFGDGYTETWRGQHDGILQRWAEHPAGVIEEELTQVLASNTMGRTITVTGLPQNCTVVASGGLCCC